VAVTVTQRVRGALFLCMCIFAGSVFLSSCSPTQEKSPSGATLNSMQTEHALESWLAGRGAVQVDSVRADTSENSATAVVKFTQVHLKDAHGHETAWTGKADARFLRAADSGWILTEVDPVMGIQGIDSEPVGIKFESIGIEVK
jgi:hypothetical protein